MSISRTTVTAAPVCSPLLRLYTLEEFWALPDPADRSHYELIAGILFMVPPPDPSHDDVDSRLTLSLARFLIDNDTPGDIYHPRAATHTTDTYLEPDMMYVSSELRSKMGKRRTSADIVFEYTSETNANYDRTTKADTYLALGVRELWLVDSDAKTIGIRNRVAGDHLPAWGTRQFGAGEFAPSLVLAGWQISVDNLFAGL
jgi:Uma2 family endonuclease